MNALEIHGLKKTYKNGVEALKGIDLNIAEGDFFALLGPNGAGKSTTISIVTSLVKKTAGNIRVFGYDLDTAEEMAKAHIGLVPQEFNFNIFEKVIQILYKQAGYYGISRAVAKPRAERYLKALGLWDKRNDRGQSLSGGQKRRLMIARALLHAPKLLILDEPTAGVDIELRRQLWQFLKELNQEGTTIILTTHYLEEAEQLCKNIGIIDQGQLVEQNSMSSLLRTLETETFVLNTHAPLTEQPDIDYFPIRLIDPHTLEVDINKDQSINALMQKLSDKKIIINSLRNKANRLEELFVRMTQNKHST